MYQLPTPALTPAGPMTANNVIRKTDTAFIPLHPDNTDYQQFKKDLANGAELKDADGTPMTADAIATFLQGLQ
jgi:hypothetical protein